MSRIPKQQASYRTSTAPATAETLPYETPRAHMGGFQKFSESYFETVERSVELHSRKDDGASELIFSNIEDFTTE